MLSKGMDLSHWKRQGNGQILEVKREEAKSQLPAPHCSPEWAQGQPCAFPRGYTQLESQTEIISSEGQARWEASHKSQLRVVGVLLMANPTFLGI